MFKSYKNSLLQENISIKNNFNNEDVVDFYERVSGVEIDKFKKQTVLQATMKETVDILGIKIIGEISAADRYWFVKVGELKIKGAHLVQNDKKLINLIFL